MMPCLTVAFLRNVIDHPADLYVNVYWDATVSGGIATAGEGTIDWDNPVNASPLPMWPDGGGMGDGCGQDGYGLDGLGDPEGAGASGDGYGPDGGGADGYGASYWTWTTKLVTPPIRCKPGVYTVGVALVDRWGNVDSGPAVDRPSNTLVVAGTPEPNSRVSLAVDIAGIGTLTFKKSLSL